jgi:hypothetical protein
MECEIEVMEAGVAVTHKHKQVVIVAYCFR